ALPIFNNITKNKEEWRDIMLVFESKVGRSKSDKIIEYIEQNNNKRYLIIDLEGSLDKRIRKDNVDFLFGNHMNSENNAKEFIKMLNKHGDNKDYDLVFVVVNTHEKNISEYKNLELVYNVKLAITVQLPSSSTQEEVDIYTV